MKKILLATTLLAASTGFAAAEVAVSGSARMGIIYDGADYLYSSRVRVKFVMSGETDGGLAFGAEVSGHNLAGANSDQTTNGSSTVFISGAFGKLTMGDVSGAADALVGQTSGVGYGPNDGLHEIGFLGATKTAVYYEYSTGALTFGLGAGQVGSDDFSVAAKYAADAFAVAIGYEDTGTDTQVSLLGSATFGAATVKAKIADTDSKVDTEYSVSLDYAMDALTVTAFYTAFDADVNHIGLGAAYDLGGGAAFKAGIVRQDTALVDTTFADVGMTFSF